MWAGLPAHMPMGVQWPSLMGMVKPPTWRAEGLCGPIGGRLTPFPKWGTPIEKFAVELVSEVAPKALTSFVQYDIGCQQRP